MTKTESPPSYLGNQPSLRFVNILACLFLVLLSWVFFFLHEKSKSTEINENQAQFIGEQLLTVPQIISQVLGVCNMTFKMSDTQRIMYTFQKYIST